jgi:hypothetical protein
LPLSPLPGALLYPTETELNGNILAGTSGKMKHLISACRGKKKKKKKKKKRKK